MSSVPGTFAHCGGSVLRKAPSRLCFPAGALLLWAGLAAMSALMNDAPDMERAELLRRAPLWVLILVPFGEALVWTVAFERDLSADAQSIPLAAIANAVALRWAFIGYAYFTVVHGALGVTA